MKNNDETIRINFRVTKNITPDLYDELIALPPGKDRTSRLLTLVVSGLNLEKYSFVVAQPDPNQSVGVAEDLVQKSVDFEVSEKNVAGLAGFVIED